MTPSPTPAPARPTGRGRRLLCLAATVAIVSAGAAACGDDDDASVDVAVTLAEPGDGADATTGTTPGTVTGSTADGGLDVDVDVDSAAFCEAAVAAETVASAGPDIDFENASQEELEAAMEQYGAALLPLLDQLSSAVPDELSDAVGTIDEALRNGVATGDDPFGQPQFQEADRELDQYLLENCDFPTHDVVAADYRFEGIPEQLDAGINGFDFQNDGAEVHEMVVFRIEDGVDATIEELIEMPEEESAEMVRFVSVAFAPPGERSATFADLEPGRYGVVCFVPVGTTSMESLEGGEEPAGPPHAAEGMTAEFQVT